MSMYLTSRGVADMALALEQWSHRWEVSPQRLDAFLENVAFVTRYGVNFYDGRGAIQTTIPQPALCDLVRVITTVFCRDQLPGLLTSPTKLSDRELTDLAFSS